MKICIDTGHGGNDPGAVNGIYKEKDFALDIALMIGKILEEYTEVIYTRTTDKFIKLSDRAKTANQADADLFISIHCNAAASIIATGTEVLVYDDKIKSLAQNICDKLSQKLSLSNRGVKYRKDLAVLNSTKMPALLIETAFISNSLDLTKLINNKNDFAKVIADEVINYYGLSKGEDYVVENIEIKLNGKIKTVQAINKDGFNYIKLRDLADDKIKVSYDDKKALPVVEV